MGEGGSSSRGLFLEVETVGSSSSSSGSLEESVCKRLNTSQALLIELASEPFRCRSRAAIITVNSLPESVSPRLLHERISSQDSEVQG